MLTVPESGLDFFLLTFTAIQSTGSHVGYTFEVMQP